MNAYRPLAYAKIAVGVARCIGLELDETKVYRCRELFKRLSQSPELDTDIRIRFTSHVDIRQANVSHVGA